MSSLNSSQAVNQEVHNRLCPRCNLLYRVGELICTNCGASLTTTPNGKTRQVTQTDRLVRQTAWPAGLNNNPVGRLIILECDQEEQSVTLELTQAQALVIGRVSDIPDDTHPDVDLTAFSATEYGVSRLHLRIMRNILIYVTDLGSRNGTFINGQRLLANMDYVLGDGDELRLGKLKFRVQFIYK